MSNYDVLECQEYTIALEKNDIKFRVYGGQIKYEQDNVKIPQANVKRQTKLDEPNGFLDFCKVASTDDCRFTKINESEIWQHITEYFEFAESNMLRIIKKPEWDPVYSDRFETTNNLISVDELENSIKTYYQYIKEHEKKVCIISSDIVCKKIDSALQNKRYKEFDMIATKIAYEPQERDYLREWLEAMKAENIDVSYDLFRHWLWQVKRYLNNKTPVYETFLVIRSATQALGKSYSIKYLLNPIKKFTLEADLTNINEERSIGSDSSKYVVMNFDEMSRLEKTNMEKFKKWVSTEYISYRPMGTNNSKNVKKIASGIGTSNPALSTIISDNTGNRRFVEINLLAKKRPELTNLPEFACDGEAWLSIWKNIDENIERGYFDPEKNINQKTFVENCLSNNNPDTDFFKDMFIWDESQKHRYNHRLDTIYMVYKKYCRAMNFKEKGKIQFSQSCDTIFDSKKFKGFEIKNHSNHKIFKLPPFSEYFATLVGVRHSLEFKDKDGLDMFQYIDDTKLDDSIINKENEKIEESIVADVKVNSKHKKIDFT